MDIVYDNVNGLFKWSVLHTDSDPDTFFDSKKGHSFAADSLIPSGTYCTYLRAFK